MIKTVILALGAAFVLCPVSRLNAEMVVPPPIPQGALTLSNVIQLVLERNETLQAKLIDFEASRQRHLAEKGAFEPDLVGSVSHEVNNRPNNAQQQNEDQNTILHESNNIYDGGIESLLPTGAKVHLGYTLSDLQNNILPSGLFQGNLNSNLNQLEFQSFFGFTVDQPLLKNFGPAVTMAGMRVAALQSKIAFQEYRKELMGVISEAEEAYWELYLGQEQVRTLEQSVSAAETILKDNRTRFDAGKISENDVMEAQAELAHRQAKLGEVRQNVITAANKLISLYAGRAGGPNAFVRAVDAPVLRNEQQGLDVFGRDAFTMNPDYLMQQEKVDVELIKLGYQRNQRLPELDVKGAYGLNGLGATPGASWDDIERVHYPSWTIGMEFRIPIGMTKVRHEYTAQEMQLESAETTLQALQSKIFNYLDSYRHSLVTLRDAVGSFQTEADYYKKLYEDAVVSQRAGKLETIRVFDFEARWFDAGEAVVESMVKYQKALRELQMLSGTFLAQHNIELTQEDLQRSTRAMLAKGRLHPSTGYLQGENEVGAYYPNGIVNTNNDAAMRDALHQREKELDQDQPPVR